MDMARHSRRDARQGRRVALLGGLVLLVLVLSTACGTSGSAGAPSPVPRTASHSAGRLAPELVGRWETRSQLDSSGSQAIVRVYRFAQDGQYDYTIALCRSSTDCTVQAVESGYAEADRGVLTLRPQTSSADGPRAFPYVVGRDPDVGDVQLHLALADGQIDIFYAG